MEKKPQTLPVFNQWLWGAGSLGFTLLERMLIIYVVFYYLPPKEYRIIDLVPDKVFLGVFTMVGIALLLGRVIDGLADPVIATLSDKTGAKAGRRKIFLLSSALPLALISLLVFFPPDMSGVNHLNSLWLGVMMCFFYISFTAYITPYFALISELGHTHHTRINLGTAQALFALLGMILATVVFPLAITAFQNTGMELRQSYQVTATIFATMALFFLYISTLAFSEKKHCRPSKPPALTMWKSLKTVLAIKAFRTFLFGELFLQFGLYMLNLGLMYYVVVIFHREESFLTVLGGITIGIALLSFPVIHKSAKKIGKKKILLFAVVIMVIACFIIFFISNDMTGFNFYLGIFLFALGGFSLAAGTILIVPTYADIARGESLQTGEQREAMFYAARNLPLKTTIAVSGAFFVYLISAFGRDIANPLGVRLTILVVAVFSLISFFFFAAYPEEEIMNKLSESEET